MLYVLVNYAGDLMEDILDEETFNNKNDIYKANGIRFSPYKTYEEYKKIAYENAKKRREQIDSIILNNELYKKALLECERRKKNNLDIIKSYEIINNK